MVQGDPLRNHSHQTSWSKVVHSATTVIGRPGPRWSTSVITVIRRIDQGGPLRNHSPHTSSSKLIHLRYHSHQTSWSNVVYSAIIVIRRQGPRWSTSVITVIRCMVQGGPLRNHSPQTSWSKLVHLRNHRHQTS